VTYPEARVSVVIPTKDAGPRFAETLRAIRRQDMGEPVDILVVDSGSTDGTVELSRGLGAQVISIAPEEFGHGRTRNLAISRCTGEYVALTVQDAIPADDQWLPALVEVLDAHRDAAGAYSRHVPRPESGARSRQAVRHWTESLGDGGVQQIRDPAEFARLPFGERQRRCTFSNVSSLIRRSVWAACPFRQIEYGEDLAWAYDVMLAGHSIVYAPSSAIVHSHDRSTWYEFRRAYVEGRVVGEVLEEDARPLSALQAAHIARLWPRAGRWARVVCRAVTPDAMVERANHLILGWYRQHFGRRAVGLLFGDDSPWSVEDRQGILDEMLDNLQRTKAADGGRLGRLRVGVRSALTRDLAARLGQQGRGADYWALSRLHRRVLFDYLWANGHADLQRRVIRESVQSGGLGDVGSLDVDLLEYVAGLLVGAHRHKELTASFARDAYRYAAAVVIGQRLGASRRHEEYRGLWRIVDPWLSGGI